MTTKEDQEILSKEPLVLLGYGAQGEAEATNLQKSGIPFILGIRPGGKSAEKAKANNMEFVDIPEAIEMAAQKNGSLVMNLADQVQAEIYKEFIAGKNVKRLVFAHGFNTHFKLIPLEDTGPEHVLVAPKGAASGLMEFYQTPYALPAILALQNSKEEASSKKWAEAYARAVGANPKGFVWADFKDETECDLFSEQALLCGGVSSLLRNAYEVMVEAGYNPQTAYFESLFELKLIVDLIWKQGITGMRNRISPTARYGDITRGDRVIDAQVKENMKKILKEVQSGEFAKEFLSQYGNDAYQKIEKEQSEHKIEKIGKELRAQLN
jgi:ketol-acid reductoisomerase